MNICKQYISRSLLDINNVDNSDVLIEEFLKENYKIYGSYTIKDGVVDIKGSIIVINKDITQLTNGLFRFGEVGGGFYCNDCDSLKTLEGAPKMVIGDFDCSICKLLKSLEGAPEKVRGNLYCNGCTTLKSLEGSPKKIDGYFYCYNCGKKFTEEEVTNICKVNKYIIV